MLNKRAIVTPDKHFPCADIPAIKAVCKPPIIKPRLDSLALLFGLS